MHEFSLCRGLLQQVIQIAEEHQASVIKSVHLKIGPLAGIEAELLKRSFPLVAHGTAAQDTRLEITAAKVTLFCIECRKKSDIKGVQLICPYCKCVNTKLLSGDEMTLDNVVLEQQKVKTKEIKASHHVY